MRTTGSPGSRPALPPGHAAHAARSVWMAAEAMAVRAARGWPAAAPRVPTLHVALMLKIRPPLAGPGLPSLAAAAGSGGPSLPPARGAAQGFACPAPAARLGVADQVRRAH